MASLVLPFANIGLVDSRNEISTVEFEGNSASFFQFEVAKKPLTVQIRMSGRVIRRLEISIENAPPLPWLEPSIQAIANLLMLPTNWDFEGAPPVHVPTAQLALEGLLRFMDQTTVAPQWTPTRLGGLQVDWHQNGIDLEIAFDSEYPAGYAIFSDLRNAANDWEGPLMSNLGELRSIAENRLNVCL
jgi:hypothetical protein